MLAVNQPSHQAPLSRGQHAIETGIPAFHPFCFSADNGFRFNQWYHPFKDAPNIIETRQQESQTSNISDKQLCVSQREIPKGHVIVDLECRKEPLEKVHSHDSAPHRFEEQVSSDSTLSCRSSGTQMNGADNLAMTGSANPRTDQLNWLADVATGGNRNAQNPSSSSPSHEKIAATGPAVIHGTDVLSPPTLLLPNSRTFNSSLLPTSPNNQRMYAPPYHAERFHLTQHQTSVMGGSGLPVYYSQAPRTSPYPSFYHGQYRPTPTYHAINSAAMDPRPRSYFTVDTYPTTLAHTQLPHSSGYHQRSSSSSSPVGLPAAAPSSPLSRTSRNVLMRSPEELQQEREKGLLSVRVSTNSPQLLREERRQSYKSPEPILGSTRQSPVCDSSRSTLNYTSNFATSKNFATHPNISQPPVSYRVPTGKEGSLKHRILRPPSINIVDPPPTAVLDAPLSAPPIRSRREPSPKHSRLEQPVAYRSYSTSESFVLEVPAAQMPTHTVSSRLSPSFIARNCNSSLLANSTLTTSLPASDPNLKYPPSFMKGSIIQLANNQLKQVEHLTTEDFIECGALSSTLRIDTSTVINIEISLPSGSAKLVFSVGQDKLQITVEAPLEHPFFVYKQGWSSCSPERSLLRYGLNCHKLKAGDMCISLREKEPSKTSNSVSQISTKLSTTVPSNVASQAKILLPVSAVSEGATFVSQTVNISPNQNCTTMNFQQKDTNLHGEKMPILLVPSLPEKAPALILQSALQTSVRSVGKRKRRWSAPDQMSLPDCPPSPSS